MQKNALLLATKNPAKQAKLRWLLEHVPVAIQTPQSLGASVDVVEDGKTHQDNAVLKAVAWSKEVACLTMATDGGLLVPSLAESWDSTRTHRFAGDDADDATRASKLLELMDDLTGMDRRVAWTEAVALAYKGMALGCWQSAGADGFILTEFEPGTIQPDFWISALLYFPYLGKTYAETTDYERTKIRDPWVKLKSIVPSAMQEYLKVVRD